MNRTMLLNDKDDVMVLTSVIEQYKRDGFTIAPGLFTPSEVKHFATYFTDMVERGGDGWAEQPVIPDHEDPLRRYPRLLQPHRGDDVAFNYMTEPRIAEHLTALLGAEPFAVQTMVYFKPPGARGQNLHQDNMYLLVQPGTCIAAWTALDDTDEENGGMMLVRESQNLPMVCQQVTEGLDKQCWGTNETPIPPGHEIVPARMKAGDTLFFNGSVIHGSYMNTSQRFRRTLIAHYIAAEAKLVAKYYFPVFRMDGSIAAGIEVNPETGGPCGVYESNGDVAMSGSFEVWGGAH